MKPVLFIALFAMLGAGLVALTTVTLLVPSAVAVERAAAPGEDTAAPLRGELAELSRQMSELSMRLASLESRVRSAGAAPATRVDADGVQASELEELRALLAALRDPATGSEPFEDVVLDVIEGKEQREREAREERRREQAEERMVARIADLTEKLGLDGYQAGEMKRILTEEQGSRDTFFREMREDGSWDREAIRDGMGGIRDTSLGQLEQVLLPGQYTQYVEQESRGFGFGGFGRSGGSSSGGGGGGENGRGGGEGGGGRRGR